jgi:hypothetical protein
MAQMGNGYGSECHLLRWMGRHRNLFDKQVGEAIGKPGERIKWLDFQFSPQNTWQDAEWKGIDFLQNDVLNAYWKEYWPQSGNIQNWDAVGWIGSGLDCELVLVEAKAHVGEIYSSTQAKRVGLEIIRTAFDKTQTALQVSTSNDWTQQFYQYANRIACLYFLHSNEIKAHLLFIYFVGDKANARRKCPQSQDEWKPVLKAQDEYLGLTHTHILSNYIHKIFLHVSSEEAL